MTPRENLKRLLDHTDPERFGWNFLDRAHDDFLRVDSRRCLEKPNPYDAWGYWPELKKRTGFSGETRMSANGNVYGRFNGKTKGECILGAIDEWEHIDNYVFPTWDPSVPEELKRMGLEQSEKFVISGAGAVFSCLRDARLIANALADTILEPENVEEFLRRVVKSETDYLRGMKGTGVDAVFYLDDWGTQDRTFVSVDCFRRFFKPCYRALADAAHEAGTYFFLHSCGMIYPFIEDLIDAGVDALQFDQPDVYPSERLAEEFADRVTFWSPVDIQKVLPTGDRALIEERAEAMCRAFRKAGGGFIAKDYPSLGDINVEPAWARWAEDVITAKSSLL